MKKRIDLYQENPGLIRRLLAGIYGRAVGTRLGLYKAGLAKPRSLPARVISVGNLCVGGTGKTPTVIPIARHLRDRGLRVAVLSRGYRGRSNDPVNVVSDGDKVILGPSLAGDEPYLMAGALPGVPVLTGRDRWVVGRQAIERFEAEVLVLDDGFQHIGLARNVNLLLLDAKRPWGNGFLLPAGALREPMAEAGRATAFLLTRAIQSSSQVENELSARFPGRPVFFARHRPVRLKALEGDTALDPNYLEGRRVLAFCGLARPMTFVETLVGLGAEVALFIKWPDHYWPRASDMEMIESKAGELGVNECVTTAKDAVKLAGRSSGGYSDSEAGGPAVWVLEVETEVIDRQDEFLDMIAQGGRPEAGGLE